MYSETSTVVIDNGTSIIKAGIAGESAPRRIFPTMVGRNPNGSDYIGFSARDNRGSVPLSYPIEYGIVTNWDDMEKIWKHTFYNEFRMAPEEHPIVLTEVPSVSPSERERMTQLVFEGLCSPSMYLTLGAVATLHSYGKTTGMVLESGDSITYVVPIVNGKVIKEAVVTSPSSRLAGRVLTDYLAKQPALSGLASTNREIIEDIKRRLCYVALDYSEEGKKDIETIKQRYDIITTENISLERERFTCPEILFQPSKFGFDEVPIYISVFNSLKKCDNEYHPSLCENIVLGGGNTMFPGMAARLEKELRVLLPSSFKVVVSASEERHISAWKGCFPMAANPALSNNWITKAHYDEFGPKVITVWSNKS